MLRRELAICWRKEIWGNTYYKQKHLYVLCINIRSVCSSSLCFITSTDRQTDPQIVNIGWFKSTATHLSSVGLSGMWERIKLSDSYLLDSNKKLHHSLCIIMIFLCHNLSVNVSNLSTNIVDPRSFKVNFNQTFYDFEWVQARTPKTLSLDFVRTKKKSEN